LDEPSTGGSCKVKGRGQRKADQKVRLDSRRRGLNCALFRADFRGRFVMPTYEYHCAKCDQNFEAFHSMRDEPYQECPQELCRLPKWGHGNVKRLLGTGAGIIFKGSGFYSTDYRSNAYREAAKKEAPATSSAASEKTAGGKEAKEKSSPATSTTTPASKPKKESAA
jgi:putative FmdB family regulatory protein